MKKTSYDKKKHLLTRFYNFKSPKIEFIVLEKNKYVKYGKTLYTNIKILSKHNYGNFISYSLNKMFKRSIKIEQFRLNNNNSSLLLVLKCSKINVNFI